MSAEPITRGPMTVIRWADHWNSSQWSDRKAVDLEPVYVESIGWLAGEDEEMVCLHASISAGSVVQSMCILQSAIVDRYEVHLG